MKLKLLFLLFLVNTFSFSQSINIPNYVSKKGLIAYYPFNGNANDESGNQNNAIVNGATLTTDKEGNLSSAYNFDGINSYIQALIPNVPRNNSPRTISGWFKSNSPNYNDNNQACLFNYGSLSTKQRFSLGIYSKGYLQSTNGASFSSDDFSVNNNYLNNTWYFFTIIYDGTSTSLYINGVYVSGNTVNLNTVSLDHIFRIGKRISGDDINEYFKGTIDDIGIWNRVLTTQEITNLYNKANHAPPPPKGGYTYITDSNFEKKLISIGVDSGVPDGKLFTSDISYLTNLNVSNSSITDLTGIQDFVALQTLTCSENQLTTLDVSKNIALTSLYCFTNQLTSINLKNGNNINLSSRDFKDNPNLSCIAVDDLAYANANWTASKDATTAYSTNCSLSPSPLDTYIPDANFEKKLIALGIDSGIVDGKVLKANIASLTSLNVSSSSIADLTGIQDFIKLTKLDCSDNKLTNLNVSKNTALIDLDCDKNQLTNLDISKNTILEKISCQYNKLTNLDVSQNTALTNLECSTNLLTSLDVSKNIALGYILCHSNQLKNLDVTKNTALTYLYFSYNQLTNIDVSKNTILKVLTCNDNPLKSLDVSQNLALTSFSCDNTQLTTLNVSQNTALYSLGCDENQLTTLDVSKNTALVYLYCSKNQLTTLDVSKNPILLRLECDFNQLIALDLSNNPAMSLLYCNDNQLASLNLKNGNNTKYGIINCKNNPNLSCIQVDKFPYSNVNWTTYKDETASYSEDCLISFPSAIISSEFEDKLIALGIDTDGKNGQVLISSVDKITTLNVSSSSISDLKGIEYFYALTSLICDDNQLTKLDVTLNQFLTALSCKGNYLTNLNVTKNKTLTDLNCSANQLTKLDLSKNTVLKSLSCSANLLTILDVTKNIALTALTCDNNNELKDLDFSKNIALTTLYCNDNKLLRSLNLKNGNNTKLIDRNFKNNPNLSCIQIDDVAYSNTNWSASKDATVSYSNNCPPPSVIISSEFENKLIALGIDTDGKNGYVLISSINKITNLNVSSSSIADLTGIEEFSALTNLNCSGNQLTSLDVSKNTALYSLKCNSNQLTNLDVSKNTVLETLNCVGNQLTNLDVSKNTILDALYCDNNRLTNLDVSKCTVLVELICNNNILTNLDVSKNTHLRYIECDSNQLMSLNLKNGNNTNLSSSNFKNNPNLTCIQVDDVTYFNTNWATAKDATASYSENCSATSILISSEFEDKLIALGIDTDGKNGSVLLSSITNVTTIDVSNSEITNLSGIEYFSDLEILICKGNLLTTINVSNNAALKYLDCSNNSLSALDVSKNKQLAELYCDGVATILDKRSDTKKASATNQLTVLDVSTNLFLTKLSCSNNQLVSLDVSNNTLLTAINCSNNKLTSLNVNNGNNTKLVNVNFKTNASLSCIRVDDAAYANTNWAGAKDATATYSKTACTLGIEGAVYNVIAVYPNPTKGEVHIDNVVLEKASLYDALGKLVKTIQFTNGSENNTLDLAGLPKGIYYVYLESEGTTTVKKIVVE